MSVDWNRTLLLLDTEDKNRFGFSASDFESRGIRTLIIPYSSINNDPGIVEEIGSVGADALIFSRNDDMPGNPLIGRLLRQLRIGYTTISAIDRDYEREQTTECGRDLLNGRGEFPIPEITTQSVAWHTGSKGTFSLIFDLEQFGGARFGMPRLLPVLESSGIRAVFFITGFIAEIYPDLIRRIADAGHEIGIHGAMHEFFQGRPEIEQIQRIAAHRDVLRNYADIRGANLIFRMDATSPGAILKSGLKYFVLFRKHLFHRSRYVPASGRLRAFRAHSGDLYFIPVGVETYEMPFNEVLGMLRSALRTAVEEGHNHVSILMHPFKDGALQRIGNVRALISTLIGDLKLRPVKLSEIPAPAAAPEEATRILYRWDENEAQVSAHDRLPERTRSWWVPPMFHSRRTENIADELAAAAVPVVLSAAVREDNKSIHVYPDHRHGGVTVNRHDPVLDPESAGREVAAILTKVDSVNLSPGSVWSDWLNYFIFLLPRTRDDLFMTIERIRHRLVRLLSKTSV